jgi:hypothetical protein
LCCCLPLCYPGVVIGLELVELSFQLGSVLLSCFIAFHWNREGLYWSAWQILCTHAKGRRDVSPDPGTGVIVR